MIDEHLAVSAGPARVGLDDAERERNRDRRVDDVAALRQHLDAGRRRDGMRARHRGAAGRRLPIRRMLAQQIVQHRFELVVRLRGDRARTVLGLERLPLGATAGARPARRSRAPPSDSRADRTRPRCGVPARSPRPRWLLGELLVGRRRRVDRPQAPVVSRQEIRVAIAGAIRIAIVADRRDRVGRDFRQRDRLSVGTPRRLGVPRAHEVHVVAVERRHVDRAARARRRPASADRRLGDHAGRSTRASVSTTVSRPVSRFRACSFRVPSAIETYATRDPSGEIAGHCFRGAILREP